jgi:hypothetical protein
MIVWLFMLIPFIGCTIVYFKWKKSFVWWELLIPTVACFITILILKNSVETALVSDTQYKGGMIVEARYYEQWSTWVTKTCSEQYACGTYTTGTGKNKTTHTKYCTRYYDCSYCDDHSPYWEVHDDQGNTWSISQSKYASLLTQWKATPQFVNQHRSISTHGSCGQDGNMYSIKWNNDMLTSEPSTFEGTYTNKVQASKSNFDLRDVSEDDAKKLGLFDYPTVNKYSQHTILGLDSMKFLDQPHKNGANIMFDYFNGYYGSKRKIRLYVILSSDKNIEWAINQRYYWDGGNKNEIVICIDVDKNNGKINWVYPFSWSKNKRIEVDLREDISEMKQLQFSQLYQIIVNSTENFTYRDFREYNYLEVDPPFWEMVVLFILTLGITIGTLWYGYKNEFENE